MWMTRRLYILAASGRLSKPMKTQGISLKMCAGSGQARIGCCLAPCGPKTAMYSGTPPYGATPPPHGATPRNMGHPPPAVRANPPAYEAVQPPHGVNSRPWLAVEPLGAGMGPVTPSQPRVRRSQFQVNTMQSRVNLSLPRVEPSQHQSVRAYVRLFSRSPRTPPNQVISLYI